MSDVTSTLDRPIPAALADQLDQAIAASLSAKRLQGHINERYIHHEVDRDELDYAADQAETATRVLLDLLHTHTQY